MKRVAVLQSNYIPWKGYFDIIHSVDLFIFHDDLQYTKNDWRNRNRIKTENGLSWMTIPVGTNEHRLILDVTMQDHTWQKKHFDRLQGTYQKAPFFKQYLPFLQHVYFENQWERLVDLNRYIVETISREFLGIKTAFLDSRAYETRGVKHEKLLTMLQSAGATNYLSGPAAKDYIVNEDYDKAGIKLTFMDYSGYPEYGQLHGGFEHGVSILDLLFHTGNEAAYYIWGWRK